MQANADMGDHDFKYCLLPFSGSIQSAGIVREGFNFNRPLTFSKISSASPEALHADNPFLSLTSESVVIDTVKRAEDEEGVLIVRLYESFGGQTNCHLDTSFEIKSACISNILEQDTETLEITRNERGGYRTSPIHFTPFTVRTVKLVL